jgi:hypothetical protein
MTLRCHSGSSGICGSLSAVSSEEGQFKDANGDPFAASESKLAAKSLQRETGLPSSCIYGSDLRREQSYVPGCAQT